MGNLFKVFATAISGAALGLLATSISLDRGFFFDAVHAGPWTGWPRAAAADSDPYAKAVISRTGEMPLGPAEGLSFIARIDSGGRKLDARCDYLISGQMPNARFWTLSILNSDGYIVEHATRRYGFTSGEVLRDGGHGFSILLSRSARPGNWLPIASDQSFVLMLRLYDSANSANAFSLESSELPNITRERCS